MVNICAECKWLRVFYDDKGKAEKSVCTLQQHKGVYIPVYAMDDACEAFVDCEGSHE